jgi:DNA-binding PucR family transcriptional regulator
VRELIREGAQMALNRGPEWFEEIDSATVTAYPAIANYPVLAKIVRRANFAHLLHWTTANVRDPGVPVAANLGPETVGMARDLVRRGQDLLAVEVYRVGEYLAQRYFREIAFELTADPQELRELLDVAAQSMNEYIEATLAGITAQIQLEHDELTRGTHADRLEVVNLILDGAPLTRERAEARLGYALGGAHLAAIVWSDKLDGDHDYLDQAAEAFGRAVGSPRPLTLIASVASRWVWVTDTGTLDADKIGKALARTPDARIAIGTAASGVEGFRRSHLEAIRTQRTLERLRSDQRVALFEDFQMVALIVRNPEAANEFIKNTLGDFESANPELHEAVLTFVNEQCNASRAAKVLHTHRNTLLRRIESAERLLPRPLENTSVRVAVALEALRLRGAKPDGPARRPTG